MFQWQFKLLESVLLAHGYTAILLLCKWKGQKEKEEFLWQSQNQVCPEEYFSERWKAGEDV